MFSKKSNLFVIALMTVSMFFYSCQESVGDNLNAEDVKEEISDAYYFYLTDSSGTSYVMSETSSNKKLCSIEAKESGNDVLVLSGTAPAFMSMQKEDDGSFLFVCNEKYLTCPASGSGISFETEISEYSHWILEEIEGKESICFIRNKNAAYKNKPQYVEYFGGFTTYGFNKDKPAIYTVAIKNKESLKFVDNLNPEDGKEEIGDAYYFYLTDSSGTSYVMSETSSNKKLCSIEAKESGNDVLVLSGTVPAFMSMQKEDDGSYLFVCKKKYLTCPATGNGISFGTEMSEYSHWILEEIEGKENTYFIKNKNSLNNGKPQYIEYYSGFTTFGFNKNEPAIYTVAIKNKESLKFVNGDESDVDMNDSGVAYKVEPQNIDPAYSAFPYGENDALLFGNPSRATKNELYAKNYLLVRPQYTLSYNNKSHNPNWVAWHLEKNDMGAIARSNNFRADSDLPAAFYKVSEKDYNYGDYGFDRGHMCPSGARTSDKENNEATFFMTNMVPQTGENNQKTWMNLEHYLQDIAKQEEKEVYIISGPAGIGGSSASGKFEYIPLNPSWKLSADDKGIVVPASTWKVALILEKGENDVSRVTKDSTVIAVNMPNTVNCHKDAINTEGFKKEYIVTHHDDGTRDEVIVNREQRFCWEYYATTIDEIESLTGFDFFANLDDEIESVLESKIYSSK